VPSETLKSVTIGVTQKIGLKLRERGRTPTEIVLTPTADGGEKVTPINTLLRKPNGGPTNFKRHPLG